MKKIPSKIKVLFTLFSILFLIITFSLANAACTGDESGESDKEVEDTSEAGAKGEDKATDEGKPETEEIIEPSYKLLYQLIRSKVSKNVTANTECYLFNFSEFMDGGLINPDSSGNKILELKKYPTSFITAEELENYYYIYSPNNPVTQLEGFDFFNWDIEGQAMITADFETGTSTELKTSPPDMYPGSVLASPENKYLAYPMTIQKDSNVSSGGSFVMEKFNPFLSDSNLVIMDTSDNQEKTVLENTYNRQLFSSFSQFSVSDDYFYTIAIENDSFKFVRISLDTGEVKDFSEAFPYFDWSIIDWDEFFPRSGDFSYANFSLSPDEERMVIYKNSYVANMKNPCSSEAHHKLWILNLEDGSMDLFVKDNGYVTDVSWNPDGSQKFALSINSHCGCYPDYIDTRIDIIDKNGGSVETLMTESKSKITSLGWSPDGKTIAYDIYGTDFTGSLKLIGVEDRKVEELTSTAALINSGLIEDTTSKESHILIMFIGWVKE